MSDINKQIKILLLKFKYRHIYANLVSGKAESRADWCARMLIECGHDPQDVKTMPFDEFIDKYNTKTKAKWATSIAS